MFIYELKLFPNFYVSDTLKIKNLINLRSLKDSNIFRKFFKDGCIKYMITLHASL